MNTLDKYTLTAVAQKVASDLEDFSGHKILTYINWAKAGWRGIQEEVMKEVKAVRLPMNSYNAIDLPDDCVDWTKVAIQVGDRLWVLGVAEDIALAHETDDCGNIIKNAAVPSFDEITNGLNLESYIPFYFSNYYGSLPISGNYGEGLYGYYTGVPYKGYFRENRDKRQLQFTSNIQAPYIYLEYITDGSVCNGSTKVAPVAFDYLVQYVHYQRVKFRQDVSIGEKDYQERALHYEYLKLTRLTAGITIKDIVNGRNNGYRMTPHI